jgi:signal peptidase II
MDIEKKEGFLRIAIFFGVAILVLCVDQFTKNAVSGYEVGEEIAIIIPSFLRLTLVHNTGAAWGMFGDWTNGLVVVALVVCALIVAFVFFVGKDKNMMTIVSCALLFSGGIGNAIDRFTNGYVVDMIEIIAFDYPVFNVADCAITIGVVLLVLGMLFLNKRRTYY